MTWIRWGALLMFAGVALGAFGAHGLKSVLSQEAQEIYEKAVWYQLIHALALVNLGCLAILKPQQPLLNRAGIGFVLGIVLFSGSLYLLSVTGIKKFGLVTPFGGLAFLAGWICLAAFAK